MDWLQFIAGIGIGTLGAKLLDIAWLQRRVEEAAHAKWLGEERLGAFAEVTKELVSFGLHDGVMRTPLQSYGAISRALLLIDDNGLIERLDRFVVEMDRMNRLTDSDRPGDDLEGEKVYLALVDESRDITKLLRNIILRGRIRAY